MNDQLTELVYVSRATRLMSQKELVEMLVHARATNHQYDVTGLLLYKDLSFIQLLEGPRASVEKIYASIEQDVRHFNVKRLLQNPIESRRFPEWAMGFQSLNKTDLENVEGYTEFIEKEPSKLEELIDQALLLLNHFRYCS